MLLEAAADTVVVQPTGDDPDPDPGRGRGGFVRFVADDVRPQLGRSAPGRA